MEKPRQSRVKEFIWLSIGGLIAMMVMFAFMFGIMSLDNSPNKCASKIAVKVFDSKCF